MALARHCNLANKKCVLSLCLPQRHVAQFATLALMLLKIEFLIRIFVYIYFFMLDFAGKCNGKCKKLAASRWNKRCPVVRVEPRVNLINYIGYLLYLLDFYYLLQFIAVYRYISPRSLPLSPLLLVQLYRVSRHYMQLQQQLRKAALRCYVLT